MRHPDYNDSRAINALLTALQVGVPLTDRERLFSIVWTTYKSSRPYRDPSHIRRAFKLEYKFLLREFREVENIPDELYFTYFPQEREEINK